MECDGKGRSLFAAVIRGDLLARHPDKSRVKITVAGSEMNDRVLITLPSFDTLMIGFDSGGGFGEWSRSPRVLQCCLGPLGLECAGRRRQVMA
jgi:hypothetical protein